MIMMHFQGGDTPIANKHRAASVHTIKTVLALINFYGITLGAPPINTWVEGIKKGWFTSWPGLDQERVKKYCTKKVQTTYGHQQLLRQGINTIKTKDPTVKDIHNPR